MTGSHEAIVSELWSELSGSLRGWFVQRVGDEHEAEDLLSECFLRVHDRLDEVRSDERVAAWIRRIARNLLVDWRRSRREAGTLEESSLAVEEEGDVGLDAVVASWLAPSIEELEPTDRETLRLTELEGLTQREAAERLGISLPALKSRVLRGRARLRQNLLACCELEFDRRGGVVAYRARRPTCEDC